MKRVWDVRLRMGFRSRQTQLSCLWAKSALETFNDVTASREPREVWFDILDGPVHLAKLNVKYIP